MPVVLAMSRPGSWSGKKGGTKFRKTGAWQGPNPRALFNPKPSNSFAPTSRANLMMPETKYFDCGINAVVTTAGSTWADTEVPCDNYVNSSGVAAAYTDSALIPSAGGSAYGQVVGNRYKLKKFRCRGDLKIATAADQADVGAAVQVRLMLVMDTQPNGAQAQGEDIMQDMGAAAENIYSYKRVADNSGRFRILKDSFETLQPAVSGTDGTNTNSNSWEGKQFTFQYTPRTPIQVNIKSGNATPTVAGLTSCNIFLLCFGITAGAAQAVNIAAVSRAYYCD